MFADHPHTDPRDGRTECETCGKFVWPAIHSCKRVPVTAAARARMGLPPIRHNGDPLPVVAEDEIRRDERRKTAEAIARAIETAEGWRCPTCGGKPAAHATFGTGQQQRSCGGGHRWPVPLTHTPAAQVARQYAREGQP